VACSRNELDQRHMVLNARSQMQTCDRIVVGRRHFHGSPGRACQILVFQPAVHLHKPRQRNESLFEAATRLKARGGSPCSQFVHKLQPSVASKTTALLSTVLSSITTIARMGPTLFLGLSGGVVLVVLRTHEYLFSAESGQRQHAYSEIVACRTRQITQSIAPPLGFYRYWSAFAICMRSH
jgi:hypothetical protein